MTDVERSAARPNDGLDSRPKAVSKAPAIAGLAVLIGAAVFVGWGVWKATNPEPVPLQGTVDATTVSVAAKIPGRIGTVNVKEGDVVSAGDVVAVIEIPEIEARLAQASALKRAAAAKADLAEEGARTQEIDAARATLERARAGETLAKKTFDRIDALYREGLVASQRHDEARAQLQNARELVAAARAQLSALEEGARRQEKEAARALLAQAEGGVSEATSLAGESDVKSPIAGEVTRVVMEPGEVAPAGFPLVLVTDVSDPWVTFNLREDDLKGVTVGRRFAAHVPALGGTFDFSVYWINPRGDYATWRATRQSSGYDLRTFEVRARPVEAIPNLRPGMTVVVDRAALEAADSAAR